VTGGGDYRALLPNTSTIDMFGREVRVVDLDKLIELKRAAGRPKDFDAIAELEALVGERDDDRRSMDQLPYASRSAPTVASSAWPLTSRPLAV
jgi:hypothetical protein